MRNMLYYDLMFDPSVRHPTRFYTPAPMYIRAGTAAAFTWGDKGTAADIIPADLVVAYEGQKGHLTDIEAQKVMDIILENVAPTNAPLA